MVSEAIFPTNRGYICIEKWSQIFVSGIGSAHSESEEKTLFKVKAPDFELLDSECPYYHLPISKKIHRETFFLSQSMLLPLVSLKFDQFDPFSQMTQKVCQNSAI